MAQIYKGKVKESREPLAPDTSTMQYFEKKRAASVDKLGETTKVIDKRIEKQIQGFSDDLEAKALQVYKNGYDLYNNDVAEYNKFVNEELTKLYDATPESKWKTRSMAKVALAGSGYDAKITRRHWDRQEKISNMKFKDAVFTSNDSAMEGLGALLSSSDTNLTQEQQSQQAEAFLNAQTTIYNNYQSSLLTDSNGNPLFTTAERALAKDKWENRGSYAVIDYAGENIQTNRNGVIALRNRLVDNQEEMKKDFDMDDDAYARTLQDIDKIIANQTTGQQLVNAKTARLVVDATVKEMDVNFDGTIGKSKYNNLDSTVSIYRQLQQADREGAYTTRADREKLAESKAKVAKAVIKQVEDNVGFKDKSATDRWFWGEANVGETAVIQINKSLKEFENSLMYKNLTDGEKDEVTANLYINVLGSLQEDENIELKDKDSPKAIERAKQIALGAYYAEIDSVVGYNVAKRADNPDDPAELRMAYANAFRQYDNNQSFAYLSARTHGLMRGK